jgi:hypothetical protein
MKKFRILSVLFGVSMFFAAACSQTKDNQNGPAVSSEIKGAISYKNGDGTTVKTSSPIVHVAFNTSSATTNYNLNLIGNSDGSYSVKGLGIGDYYVNAEYTDAVSGLHYTGYGAIVHIKNVSESLSADLILH